MTLNEQNFLVADLVDIAIRIGGAHLPDRAGSLELLEGLERSEWLQVWSSVLFLHKCVP